MNAGRQVRNVHQVRLCAGASSRITGTRITMQRSARSRRCCAQISVGTKKQKKYILGCACGCCCLLLSLSLLLFMVGWGLVSMTTCNQEQDPNWTPVQFPRYNSCGGCRGGYKTDEELSECVTPCYNLTLVKSWERFNEENGFKLVYFLSRPGPGDKPPVNISAWWLPAPVKGGKLAPRVVVMHGLASNNNHCGVQMTCFHLRSLGYSCLTPSARDFGLSGASTHPDIVTWGFDYHLDLLGAWDYAVEDPDGVLGGALPDEKVGLMGFSKGAYAAGIAMGLEPRISSAWLDSAPLHGLHGSIIGTIQPYVGRFLAPILALPVFWGAQFFSGNTVDSFDLLKLLSEQCPRQRRLMLSQSSIDNVVPIEETEFGATVLSGMLNCYLVFGYTPPEYCNGARHHQEMWEFPDDMRQELCRFWSRAFKEEERSCHLTSLPSFQIWSPYKDLPPGSPELV
ncbi:unnamed protein product [Durusdinium trenchii]|uniref:Uncharacterized protein n=2 Tax=Durusdinium trenchii TaxID=1381693 RepID=A0ABP0L7Y5_9DINO